MKAENTQSPVDKFKITELDTELVEIEFYTNITEKEKKDTMSESGDTIISYEYDYYRIVIRNRPDLYNIINDNYDEWLQYAIKLDPNEYTPSDLEIAEAQYKEYETMDKPSVIKEMEMQDPAIAEELINMLIELRNIIYSLQAESETYSFKVELPKPSKQLLEFKNKFNKI